MAFVQDPDFTKMQQSHGLFAIATLLVSLLLCVASRQNEEYSVNISVNRVKNCHTPITVTLFSVYMSLCVSVCVNPTSELPVPKSNKCYVTKSLDSVYDDYAVIKNSSQSS